MNMKSRKEKDITSIIHCKKLGYITKKYKRLLKIPLKGFEHGDDRKNWIEGGDYLNNNIYLEYKNEVTKLFGSFNFKPSEGIFLKFLLSTTDNYKNFEARKWFYDFSLIFVRKDRINMTKGIYIKISPVANLTDIRKFISLNSKLISRRQSFFKDKIDSSHSLKYSLESSDAIGKRDYMIYAMSGLTRQQIMDCWDLDKNYPYKEQLISRAMIKEGFKVSNENVKKIISRMSNKMSP
jgi:uncharacterized protein YneF (UPF0154 family)